MVKSRPPIIGKLRGKHFFSKIFFSSLIIIFLSDFLRFDKKIFQIFGFLDNFWVFLWIFFYFLLIFVFFFVVFFGFFFFGFLDFLKYFENFWIFKRFFL